MKNLFTLLLSRAFSGYSKTRKIRIALTFVIAVLLFQNQSFAQFGYTFSQTSGTYTPITGGTVLFSGTFDDDVSGPITIPSFTFLGVSYTSMFVNTNGHLVLGTVSPGTTNYSPISGTTGYSAAISPFGRDLNQAQTGTPEIRWQVIGNEIIIQWKDVRRYDIANERLSFQARLNTSNNGISFIYDTAIAGSSATYPQVGLRGSNNTVFDNRSVLVATGDWINSVQGTLNTATCYFNSATPTTIPSPGLTYTYAYPTSDNISSTTVGGDWNNPATWVGGVVPDFLDNVTIADGATVTVNVSPVVASLTVGQGVSGILNFNAAAARNLTVNGNVTVLAGGAINTIPTTGTSVRQITLSGNFANAGACDLSQPNFALTFVGTSPQTFGGTGSLANSNGLGQIQINNPAGVMLMVPVRLAFNLDLINGNFNVGSNLTFNHTVAPTAASHTIRRSPVSQIVGTPTFVSDTVNVQYVVFVGQTSATITTGAEIPASRNINSLTLNNTTGVNLSGGDLNVRAGATALTLSSGVLNIPPSNSITFTNPAYTAFAGGSDASHLNGTVKFRVNSTSAQTRTIPIGNGTERRQLGFGGLITGGSLVEVTVNLGNAPSGSTNAPLTTVMGNRSFRVQSTGGLGAGLTLTLNWGPQDNLAIGTVSQLRVAQSSSISGTWTERSVTSTFGSFTGTGSRTTTAGIDLANGEFFTWATTSGLNVEMNALVSPINFGCKSSSENIVVRIVNRGISTNFATNNAVVSGSVTLPNNTIQPISPVTLNSGSLSAGGFQLVNLGTLNMADSGNYQFQLSVALAGDSIATNDTIRQTVRSASLTGSANPSTVPLGSSSQLTVTGNRIPNFTPVASKPFRLTEITMFRTGTGATTSYPSYFPTSDDMLEFTNLSTSPVNIGGDSVIVLGVSLSSFVFPAGTTVAPGEIVMVFLGTGVTDTTNKLFFTGSGSWTSGSNAGIILKSGATVYDAVAFNGYTFPAGLIPSNMWTSGGALSPSGRAGSSLLGLDRNDSLTWSASNTPGPLQSQGRVNPGLFDAANATISWTGPSSFSASGVSVSTGSINQSGLRTYNATVTEPGCASINRSVDVTVLPPATPIAGFSASSLSASIGGTVTTITLTDTSKNFPSNWKWTITPSTFNFVSSTSDSSQNPQIQFSAVGLYTVKLRVSNVSGSDSVTRTDYITVTGSYCTPAFPSNVEPITLVNFAGINRTTPNTLGGPALINYQSDTASVNQGVSYPITVKGNTDGNFLSNIKAFVDWNRDFDFTDLGEEFNLGTIVNSTGIDAVQLVSNIQVPLTAPLGLTRIRIIKKYLDAAVGSCNTAGFGQAQDFSINVLPAPLCLVPFGLASINVTSSSATLRWQAASPSLGYQIQYGVTGFTLGSGTIVTSADTVEAISGLASQTPYQVYVRNICAAGDTSAWSPAISFTTLCASVPLPYTETFDSTSTSVSCWTLGTGWSLFNVNATGSSGRSARFNFFNISAGTRSNMVSAPIAVTPANHRLRFAHAYAAYTGGEIDTLIVYTSSNNGSTWTQLVVLPGGVNGSLNTAGSTASSFTPTSLAQWSTFSTPIPAGVNLIRFEAVSDFGNNLYIDDVRVEPTPSCATPTGLAASAVTVNSATLRWNRVIPSISYQIQYGPTGFALGTGTFVSSADTIEALSGLLAQTAYQVYVRNICAAGDTSQWSTAISFATQCTPVTVPYSQNFNGVTAPAIPSCITTVNSASNSNWQNVNGTILAPPIAFPSSPNAMVSFFDASQPKNDWFFLPSMTLDATQTYKLQFQYRGAGWQGVGENLRVVLSGTQSPAGSIDTVWVRTNLNMTAFAQADTNFTVPSTGVYSLGFHAFSVADLDFIAVDDIQISIVSGLQNDKSINGLSIFPNPSNGIFNIKLSDAKNNAAVTITDVAGKQIISKVFNADAGLVDDELNMSGYAKGVYYATFINGDSVKTIKLIVD
jgi:hypothetical protein